MVHIFCSSNLHEILPKKPSPCADAVPDLERWCVTVTSLKGKTVVAAMCAASSFGFLIWNVKPDHLARLPEIVAGGIRDVFDSCGIRKEITDDYLAADPVFCSGVPSQDADGLDDLEKALSTFQITGKIKELIPLDQARLLNNRTVDISGKEPYIPLERMLECLKERYQMKPICRKAYQLTATLDFETHQAVRVLEIPAEYTYAQLHHALQILFSWEDRHDHEFSFSESLDGWQVKEGSESKDVSIVQDEDQTLDEDLSGLEFPFYYRYDHCTWVVSLEFIGEDPEYDLPYPICLDIDGASPPENVGGRVGFAEFLKAYNDLKHPEHLSTKEWAGLWRQEPQIQAVNSDLAYV